MPTNGLLFPGANPEVVGNKITVERFVKSPSQVFRVLSDLTKERFISDYIYSSGDAQGGAVIYDEVSENDLYASGDPREIAPGDEFPLVTDQQGDPITAAVTKRGSAFPLTYEAVRRDQRDVLQRGLLKLRNTSVRKHDAIGVSTLFNHPRVHRESAVAPWDDPSGTPWDDSYTGSSVVENTDLGYSIDTALINPQEALKLLKRKDLRDYLPRENTNVNPILTGKLTGLFGVNDWIASNRVPAGKVAFLQKKIAGSIRDEVPFYSRVVNQEDRERYLIMAGRVSVPIVTDPLAVYILEAC